MGHKGQVAPPTLLGDAQPILAADRVGADGKPTLTGGGRTDRQSQPADQPRRLDGQPDNPYFAKATVNRLWFHYLGRGVVNPVDDMRVTSPPTVPGLLDAIGEGFRRAWLRCQSTPSA